MCASRLPRLHGNTGWLQKAGLFESSTCRAPEETKCRCKYVLCHIFLLDALPFRWRIEIKTPRKHGRVSFHYRTRYDLAFVFFSLIAGYRQKSRQKQLISCTLVSVVRVRCLRFTKLCWVRKHLHIIMKPTNSPTQRQPSPRKIGLKVGVGPLFQAAIDLSWVRIGFI